MQNEDNLLGDYSMLISIAENSGRDTYITDEKFRVVWTNAEKPLIEVLNSADISKLGYRPLKETAISCGDGMALKITPLLKKGITLGYMFEKYSSTDLVMVLSKTKAFEGFADQYNDFRNSLFDLVLNSVPPSTKEEKDQSDEKVDDLLSSTANKTALFSLFRNKQKEILIDLHNPLFHCAYSMKLISDKNKTFKVDMDIEERLFIVAHHTTLEYTLINLMLNAYQYCNAKIKEITVKGYREGEKVVAEISDNGTDVDLDYINSFRSLYRNHAPKNEKEGLGITIAQVFAEKYGGSLELLHSKTGGLCVRLKLPYQTPDDKLKVFESQEPPDHVDNFMNILKKSFSADELFDVLRFTNELPKY
ncbi:MAG: sensor histidine kinase [Oscillospiraceae bacterium]